MLVRVREQRWLFRQTQQLADWQGLTKQCAGGWKLRPHQALTFGARERIYRGIQAENAQ